MSEAKLDTKKLARPWLNNDAQAEEESYIETPIPAPIKQKKPKRFSPFLVFASVGLASTITLLVVVTLVLVFGVKI
jgi:hypothetical protein